MRPLPRLVEVFRFRKLKEGPAWTGDRGQAQKMGPEPQKTAGSTFADVGKQLSPLASKEQASFEDLIPVPMEKAKTQKSKYLDKGFKKLGDKYVVNPKHWERGGEHDGASVNWEGDIWIKPKSQAAREVAKIMNQMSKKTKLLEPEVWNTFAGGTLAAKFGKAGGE